ncbi:MAG TPA: MopE-related protein [Myxococcota bacterium]|nr:MopE-related protein [Myxococcota bacterium]
MTLLIALACNKPSPDDSQPVVHDSDPEIHDSDEPVDTGPFDEDGDGYAAKDDCDDGDVGVHPDANEFCDGIDQDCDGDIDEDAIDATLYYPDADGDGYGILEGRLKSCEDELDGYMSGGTGQWDCDDDDPDVHPAAEEVCDNGVDDDCDGGTSESCRMEGEISSADAIFRGTDGDLVGHAMTLGDYDGDGAADLAIDALNSVDDSGVSIGRVYIAQGPLSGEVDLATGSVANFSGSGADLGDYARIGDHVVSADFDEDGNDDLLISVHLGDFDDDSSGAVFLHYGPFSGDIDVADAAGLYGTSANDGFGHPIIHGQDLTGDGQIDLVVGGTGAESVWVFDRVPTEDERPDIAFATVTSGVSGTALFGRFADASGDTDGDGVTDLAVSAPWAGDDGSAWVVLGPLSGSVVCDTDGVAIEAESGDGGIGYGAVSNGGDLDGDGYDDLLVSHYQNGAWVFLGPVDSARSTSAADARFQSSVSADYFGERGTGIIDDLDLDGSDEVQVAQPQIGGGGPGYARFWYGPVSGSYTPADADFTLVGEADDDWFGYELHPADDANADGAPDLMVGAQENGANRAGAAYLFTNSIL